MKLLSLCISIYLLSYSYSQILPLTKYGTKDFYGNLVYFESKGFKDGEDMHFKIEAGEFSFDCCGRAFDVEYYYTDSNWVKKSNYRHVNYKKTSSEEDLMITKYFTITKKKSEYSPSNGDYMVINFLNFDGSSAIITNTKEDEGKIETWVIVVIVIACVAIIAGLIIFFVCRRIRMQKARQAAMATNVAVMNAQNQAAVINAQNQAAAYNYAAQNAAYQAAVVENAQNAAYAAGVEDAQNAMLAQKNYQNQVYQGQGQAYQAQGYQNNNYNSPPPGVVPDAGYNSKTAM